MNPLGAQLGQSYSDHPLRKAFMKWQCHVRQIAMRQKDGRPDDEIMPAVYLPGEEEPMGHVITLISKAPGYSVTPELQHMAAKTHDPAQRRETALQFLSSAYYQKAAEFSDIMTATFPPGSEGAARIHAAGECRLVFEAYSQQFDLTCKVWRLAPHNLLHQATIAHNKLFNSTLSPDIEVLGFEPAWDRSSSDPSYV